MKRNWTDPVSGDWIPGWILVVFLAVLAITVAFMGLLILILGAIG